MTRAAQSTGSLLRVVKNHLAKENVMTDNRSIPLNKLTAWDGNVRKTAGADTALAELAASIAAHGQNASLDLTLPPLATIYLRHDR